MEKFIYKIKFWVWGLVYKIDRVRIAWGYETTDEYVEKRIKLLSKILKGIGFLK